MLRQAAHALTGAPRWVPATVTVTVEQTTHLDMLHDGPRARGYARALAAAGGRAGDGVLDVGTGTGVLALMARREGAEKVAACEYHPGLAEAARRVAEANGAQVRVHAARSDRVEPADLFGDGRLAQLVVSEIFDSGVLGEGVIASIRDARARLLVPGARVIPAKVRVRGAPAACPALQAVRGDRASVVTALHWPALAARFGGTLLAKPQTLIELDFEREDGRVSDCHEMDAGKNDGVKCARTDFPIPADANVDAVVVWFDIDFLGDGSIGYTTAPMTADELAAADVADPPGRVWCDHWKTEVFVVRPQKADNHGVVHVLAAHTDDSLRIGVDELLGETPRVFLDEAHEALASGSIATPTFKDAYGSMPWRHALRWWYEASGGLDTPWRACSVCACLVAAPALARTRQPLRSVDGIDLSAANAIVSGDGSAPYPFPLWQAPSVTAVSDASVVLRLDPDPSIVHACEDGDAAFLAEGTATLAAKKGMPQPDLIVMWVRWEQGEQRKDAPVPTEWPLERQAVIALPPREAKPNGVGSDHGSYRMCVRVRAADGEVEVSVQ